MIALGAFNGSVTAAPSEAARREIAALIGALDGSSCRFQRNGSWHDAAEARAHLQRKYDYLLKKDKVDTAEQFIERAASQSSMSGRPYRIACPGQPEQTAAAWFGARLQALRKPR
ncbi:YfeK family protein [Stenotrophomonas sp. NPDC047960]|uniref:YfeK family protein n=1 Tax=Stenotrophomonas sp. NPDC047960 TaxID=3364531 RepID=UPI00371F4EB7